MRQNEEFWSERTKYRTYRDLLSHMAATIREGLSDGGVRATWTQHAAVFALVEDGRYRMFAFTGLPCRFMAEGASADEAYGSLVSGMDRCRELDRLLPGMPAQEGDEDEPGD